MKLDLGQTTQLKADEVLLGIIRSCNSLFGSRIQFSIFRGGSCAKVEIHGGAAHRDGSVVGQSEQVIPNPFLACFNAILTYSSEGNIAC